MSTEAPNRDKIKIQTPTSLEGGEGEALLKKHLGRGIYVHNVSEVEGKGLEIALGNATPRDLSDCRDRNNVLKFVTVRDVCTLYAEATSSGYYVLDIPDRDDIVEKIREREDEILDRLDFSMAQAIYGHVYDLPDVRNQLNPILELLQWMRREGKISKARLNRAQQSENTNKYLTLLDDLGYVNAKGEMVESDEGLQSADLNEMDREEFGRKFLGDVVQRGYYTIRDQLELSMLGHYQKYAGAYYFDAVQLGDPELWLDTGKVTENLKNQYGEEQDELYVSSKLSELDRVGVLEREGEYVQAEGDVFDQVASETPPV
jgi:hypothetical protein